MRPAEMDQVISSTAQAAHTGTGRSATTVLPAGRSYAGTIYQRGGASHDSLEHLDEPHPAIAWTPGGDDAARTFRLQVEQEVVGIASVSRQLPPGPPMRGVYRIHDVAVRGAGPGRDNGAGVIERCIAHAAANGGRTLWCHATLAAVDIWRRHGFSLAGPPAIGRDGVVGVFMVRRLTPADIES